MDKNVFEGNWKQIKGHAKETWGKLTDDDINQIDGKKDNLLGRLQERYGYAKEEAETKLAEFMTTVKDKFEDVKDMVEEKLDKSSNTAKAATSDVKSTIKNN